MLLAILVLLGGCGEEPIPERITGVVTEVRPTTGPVRDFSVEGAFGTFEVRIDPDRDYGFDLRHLEEHRDTGDPVIVRLEDRGGQAFARSIEDA